MAPSLEIDASAGPQNSPAVRSDSDESPDPFYRICQALPRFGSLVRWEDFRNDE